ncbi:MAG: cytochrome-c peroxidase [Paracoccaceae bacterium]
MTDAEIEKILSHGPWPPDATHDPSNRVSGDPVAIALGEMLFNDTTLSAGRDMSCATCHQPDQQFADGLPRAIGQKRLDRNTQSLWNAHLNRWFGWSGDTDNLWAQNLTPLFNADEMALDPESLQSGVAKSQNLASYQRVFGPLDAQSPMDTSVNVSKALAAYLETLTTGRTSFDSFRDALATRDQAAMADYPEAALRGLRLFVGHGNCATCHSGPRFSNGEFHDAGVPYFLEHGRVDAGRHGGLQTLMSSPFTLDGAYSDDPDKTGAWAVRSVRFQHSDFGTFRVPSLRRVTLTAPYMHDGSLPDLRAVLNHYNHIDMERLHADGEAILRPLSLRDDDLNDLAAFLYTLSDD